MVLDPMLRDVEPPGDPDAAKAHHVVEKALQPGRPRGMADEPHVQPDRHHLRLRATLLVQHVEGVLVELEIVARGAEGAAGEFAVVVDERVRDDEVRFAADRPPVRQLVVIGVGIVEEADLLDAQPPRYDAWSIATLPAYMPSARRLPVRGDVKPQ